MAAGSILTVLSQVPWGQVIDAAPKVAEGASKLWKTVKRRGHDEAPDSVEDIIERSAADQDSGRAEALLALGAQVQRLQKDLTDLREEMQSATGLIKELAEQNTALVQRIELNRRRLRQLAWGTAGLGLALASALAYLFAGGA